MKKLFFILSLAVLATGFYACTDLQEEPIGLLAPQSFFKTPADLETAALGTYAWIANEQMYGRKMVLTLQLRSDMSDIGDRNTPGRRQDVNDFNMDSNNGMVTAIWPNAYRAIGAANAAVDGAAQIEQTGPAVDEIVAEARFLRAFVYYHLVRLFGDIPYIDFFISDPSTVSDLAKTPAAEVYANIIADLEFAKANLPDTRPGGIRTRPTRGTATAYLSSVHLTLGNWQDAYNSAKEVIDNKGTFGYDLVPDFAQLWKANEQDGLAEHIFAVDFLGNQNGGSNQNTDWMGPITGIRNFSNAAAPNGGWSVSVPAFKVFESWDDLDYRKEVSFVDSGFVDGVFSGYEAFAPNHGSPRPHMAKYFEFCGTSRGDCGRSDNNYVTMRYAEILLIAAEAGNEVGASESEILGYLNEVRGRARNWPGRESTGMPTDVNSGLGQGALRDLILDDRRLELAFEFKRWYDIKRRQLGDEVFKGPNSLEPHDNFDSGRDYLLPLPQDELDRNENLAPQNPGY